MFPGEFVAPERVVTTLISCNEATQFLAEGSDPRSGGAWGSATQRPLFILLDATWPEARKMFRKSPYLDALPVLSLQPERLSRYRLRRSRRDDHFCTSEVASLCFELANEPQVAEALDAYLDVFTSRYLSAKQQLPVDWDDAAHHRWRDLGLPGDNRHPTTPRPE